MSSGVSCPSLSRRSCGSGGAARSHASDAAQSVLRLVPRPQGKPRHLLRRPSSGIPTRSWTLRSAGSRPRGEGVRIWSGDGVQVGKIGCISFVDSLTLALCERVSCLEGAHADFARAGVLSWQHFARSCSLPLKSHILHTLRAAIYLIPSPLFVPCASRGPQTFHSPLPSRTKRILSCCSSTYHSHWGENSSSIASGPMSLGMMATWVSMSQALQ